MGCVEIVDVWSVLVWGIWECGDCAETGNVEPVHLWRLCVQRLWSVLVWGIWEGGDSGDYGCACVEDLCCSAWVCSKELASVWVVQKPICGWQCPELTPARGLCSDG